LDEKFGFEGVIGNSPKMQQAIVRMKAFAPTNATVLILGENGTGKELVAKALHTNSPRKNKPFVPLNCTAFNENLLDDELFGHEPGSFTGADKMRKGRFEFANGGTLFLDEVGDLPVPLQAKLLRVLENREVTRIGSNDPIKVNVRLISATNRDLEAMIAEGKFRQDLYHRLKVGTIRLPALRERKEDILLLAEHFRKEFTKLHGKSATISPELQHALKEYAWPGNVRELRNVIESLVVQDFDGVLNLDDIEEGEPLRKSAGHAAVANGSDHLIGRPLSEVERYYMEKALEVTNQNREEAAKMLGIGERTLYRMIQDGKLRDKIKQTLTEENGDHEKAAAKLGMKPDALGRKLKKLGSKSEEEEEKN
jgi:two-component system response regulator HydG